MNRRRFLISLGATMTGIAGLNDLKFNQAGSLMPALFVGHGSPMNLLYKNKYTETFARLGQALPKPSAILCISAHWLTANTEIVPDEKPKQIFDFYGFPEELYQILYAPEGSPQVAMDLSKKNERVIPTKNWGLDHGSWSVLHHMYPAQNIPILQMSIDQHLSPLEHLQMARQLKYLRQSGVLIMGSGNIVHNLRRIDWNSEATPHGWAVDFEEFVLQTLQAQNLSSEEKVKKIFSSPQLHIAHPSIEHLLPLVYVLGVAGEDEIAKVEVRGIQNAAVSMAAVSFQKV